MPFEKTSLKRRPDLEEEAHGMAGDGSPAFLLHGDITHWEKLFDEFADYQILFHDPAGRVVAEVLRAMRSPARENDLASFVTPVRPTLKGAYLLTPFWRYVGWERAHGSAFDPWLRVHRRLGAEPLKLMPEALTVVGTVAEWEEWTGMTFPESCPYVVPGALQPVVIDRERNLGRYDDPDIWMRHPVP